MVWLFFEFAWIQARLIKDLYTMLLEYSWSSFMIGGKVLLGEDQ